MKLSITVPYGPLAKRHLQGVTADDRCLETLIGGFYEALFDMPRARAVLANLSESELNRLHGAQVGYLKGLMAADLDADGHRAMAEAAGRRHLTSACRPRCWPKATCCTMKRSNPWQGSRPRPQQF